MLSAHETNNNNFRVSIQKTRCHNLYCAYISGCRKDILVIWDNSNSIGEGNFKDRIEPFLERLINSTQLNVGEDGTQFGFITFSTEERTKTLLKFGKYKTRKDLIRWLKALNYETLNGVFTYTGEALKLADEVS